VAMCGLDGVTAAGEVGQSVGRGPTRGGGDITGAKSAGVESQGW
jgi:hypothetical protein